MKHDVDHQLARMRAVRWPGADRNERVETFIAEQCRMNLNKHRWNRATIGIVVAAFVGGGAVAAGVTHQVMSRRTSLRTDDGRVIEAEVLMSDEPGTGAAFADDKGVEHRLRLIEGPDGKPRIVRPGAGQE